MQVTTVTGLSLDRFVFVNLISVINGNCIPLTSQGAGCTFLTLSVHRHIIWRDRSRHLPPRGAQIFM